MPPAAPAFGLLFCPHPPAPLPRGGRGRFFSLFRRGRSPRHPGIKPLAALTEPANPAPAGELNPYFATKTTGNAFLWTEPAAKERGDRGRGTSAFEMVLSPGAGRTSAARVQPPRRTPQRQSEQVPRGFSRRNAGGFPPPQKKQRLQAKKSAKKP